MMSLPESFLKLIESYNAPQLAGLSGALLAEPSVAVRVNRLKGGSEPAGCDAVPWCADGFYLPGRIGFTFDPAWHQGLYYVQDASSMIVAHVVRSLTADGKAVRLLDACAAPGGKTTAALSVLPEGSAVVANEYVAARCAVLRENLAKWGYGEVAVAQGDTAVFRKAPGAFDIIIADVPCSGEGMMRKEEEARRQWSPGLVADCAALQREIAANGARALREGGLMLYSTCTFNAEENEHNVEWICAELGFEVVDVPADPVWGLRSHGPGWHFYPHLTGSEGLYVCLLRKVATAHRARMPKKLPKPVRADLAWCDTGGRVLYEHDDQLFAISEEYLPHMQAIGRQVLQPGTPIAAAGKRGWEPTHAAAMSQLFRRGAFTEVELNEEQALRYLARRTDGLPETSARGYVLTTYHDMPLGWLKALGNRYNNLYPQNWRIRQNVP